ncbi:MAG: sulfite exporter TauE/SafE family protein [Pelagibacteraceae bacterium]|tara:strand:+ start:21 stop:854 length:834 start_codon:yes stop_codon:yes gene_type:complete
MTGNLQLDQILFLLIIMILTAFPAGFAAGLFGIGGGLITVPILFYIFSNSGIESSYLMHLAVGTSFAIIIPTSTVSVMTHHQHKAVDFSLVKGYGIFVITGVVLGTIFAANLKTKPLILFFSLVVYMLAFYLLFLKEKEKDIKINMGLPSKIVSGLITGFISAPMGIGGAVMNVPILKFFGYPINKAIGSAAAIGFIIALFGAIGFFISGNYLKANLPLSVGFINIPAFLIFVPITTFMARLGAKKSHRIDKKKLTKYFGFFLIIIGSKFLFDYFQL